MSMGYLSTSSFTGVLQFSVYKSFTSLDKFILRYLILLNTIANGTVFLISLSDSLSVQKHNKYCLLILYSSTLCNSFISYIHFLVESLGFYIYSILPSANNDTFTLSFPIWLHFISFSCLITVVRTPNTCSEK